jgi:hypothetical protein
MDIKELFKPSILKIIIAVSLLFIFSYMQGSFFMGGDYFPFGSPFFFYYKSSIFGPAEYNIFFLIPDIIIWYIISSLIVIGITKFHKDKYNKRNIIWVPSTIIKAHKKNLPINLLKT